ncbi:hypothetical protein ACIBHY_21675 [Nonomuraea sp. NPDC050547]|uniref:hypothetical protein n=1 Tax=Nonomuraea sp. NPDC050547 TaxID=3364368 RepID=UPI0037A1A2C8
MSLSDVIRNIAKTITNKEKAKELPLVVIQSTLSAAGQALLLVDRVKNSIKGLASREEVEETKRPAAEQLAESAEDKPARREPVIFAPRPSATGTAEPNGTAPKAKADPVIFTPATKPDPTPSATEPAPPASPPAEAVSAPEAVEAKPVVVEEPAAEKPAAKEAVTTEAVTAGAVTKEPVGEEPSSKEPTAKEAVTEAVVVESAEPVAKRATTRRASAKPKTVTPEAAASDEAEAPVKKPARKAPARTAAAKPAASKAAASKPAASEAAASKPAASRAAAAKPAAKKAVAEPVAGEAVEAAGAVPGEPLVGYGELTVASLRARMRGKSAAQIGELLAYERATQGRPEVVKMYENRLAKLEAGE